MTSATYSIFHRLRHLSVHLFGRRDAFVCIRVAGRAAAAHSRDGRECIRSEARLRAQILGNDGGLSWFGKTGCIYAFFDCRFRSCLDKSLTCGPVPLSIDVERTSRLCRGRRGRCEFRFTEYMRPQTTARVPQLAMLSWIVSRVLHPTSSTIFTTASSASAAREPRCRAWSVNVMQIAFPKFGPILLRTTNPRKVFPLANQTAVL